MREEFWSREDLCYKDGRLQFAGYDAAGLAATLDGPGYFYSRSRAVANLQAVKDALDATGLRNRIFYAMKANRFQPLLTAFRHSGLCGIDVCSPGEMQLALSCGFAEEDISYTATSVSNADLDILARHPGVLVNCDSQSTLRRLAERCSGRTVGFRINPALGTGYGTSELLRYSGSHTTKFGIYLEQFPETLELAASLGMPVRRIHFHTGCGYLNEQLPAWEEVLRACLPFIDSVRGLEQINLGGGLGVRHTPGDPVLDLSRWSEIIRRVFGGRDVEIAVEPGDRIVKDAGMLLLQINTVEKKRDTLFVGVNGGFNLAMEPVFYKLHFEPAVCVKRSGDPVPVTVAGNINEALDIWVEQFPLPPVEEGDYLAVLNAGGYSSSMSSNHCVRGSFYERMLF